MNIYVLLGGIGIAVAIFFGGYYSGHAVASLDAAQARAVETDRVIVRQQIIIKEVPKIVTKVVTKELTIEKEVERVVVQIPHMLAPDCVLPGDFGMLLVAAANGLDPAASGLDELTGSYGCRETLAAILTDLSAGWQNSERLEGLQEYENVVNPPTKGTSP